MNAFLQKRSISTVNEMLHSFNLEMRNSDALSHWPNAVTSQRFCQLEDAMFEKPSKEMKKAYLRIQPRSPLSSLSGSCQGMMRTKFLCCAWSPPQSQSLRMVPVTKTRAFLFFFLSTGGVVCLERHSGAPQCVGTRLLPCVEEAGKPLVPWEGNPWIWSDNTDA